MLCLPSSAAAAFRPVDPAERGVIASQRLHQSIPHATTAARGMLSSCSTAPFRPADPAARGAMGAKQQSFRMREFDYFVVVDFEATCVKDARIYPQEIIEFPAVLVDAATGGMVSSFRTYVKPRHHPVLTAFCTELTGIKQEQVDSGVDLATALALHDKWLAAAGVTKNSLAIVTWGDWDCKTMLDFECKFKDIPKPSYFNQWINLRIPFEAVFGAGRRNLQEAVREAGLQWDGRLHCGLDDACNTARLLVKVMQRGAHISITGSLVPPPLPEPEPELQPEPKPHPELLPQPPLSPVNHNLTWREEGAATPDCSNCYCGIPIRGGVVTIPGPMQGRFFIACGNWMSTCPFFFWVT
jgi:ERI1 exoribonuclease 2